MKIVRIIARLNVGGPARHVAWLTAGLQGGEWESVLVAGTVPPGEDDMSYFAAEQGVVPVTLAEMSREISPNDAVTVWKLYRLFCRLRPDIVHTHTAKAGTVGRVAGMLYRWLVPSALVGKPRRCRFVHTYHGHVFHSYYGRWKTRLFLAIERFLARMATDRIVVISPQQYREIHEEFGVGRAAQFAVVPLGLDLDAFAGWESRRQRAAPRVGRGRRRCARRHRRASDRDQKSRAVPARRRALQRDATRRQRRRRRRRRQRRNTTGGACAFSSSATVTCAPRSKPRRGRSDSRTMSSFTGTRDDPENFYAALDVVALTSNNEGTPLTLIEAMANARACIATAVGGVVDVLGGMDESLPGRHPGEGWQSG